MAWDGEHNSETFDRPLFASLFSGAGIGDIGLRAAGLRAVAMCDIEPDRSALSRLNFPEALHFARDVADVGDSYCDSIKAVKRESTQELFLVSCTPPCQGMSKSGQGTLLKNIREGKRPTLDPRNTLILPALDIIRTLQPLWVVFENVVEMRSTFIADSDGTLRPILDIIRDKLGDDYRGDAYDVEFANYGIPQRRKRLITVYTRMAIAKNRFLDGHPLVPPASHSQDGKRGTLRWVSVTEALQEFEPLDAVDARSSRSSMTPFHYVPVLDPKKYEWVRHAKPGSSAFDNQCINPACLHIGNATHGTARTEGINQSRKDTPLYCEVCSWLLPRPYAQNRNGEKRIMSGFTSAYKRMDANQPAPALTRNLSYPCSDNKIHPSQNRVLSLAEAMTIQTIARYDYYWGPVPLKGKSAQASDSLIRLVIGESVPPFFMELLAKHIMQMSTDSPLELDIHNSRKVLQLSLL